MNDYVAAFSKQIRQLTCTVHGAACFTCTRNVNAETMDAHCSLVSCCIAAMISTTLSSAAYLLQLALL